MTVRNLSLLQNPQTDFHGVSILEHVGRVSIRHFFPERLPAGWHPPYVLFEDDFIINCYPLKTLKGLRSTTKKIT